jgi:hypothetical protein
MQQQLHPLHRWRRRNRYYHQDLDALHQFLIPHGKRVLEIGSGSGILLNALQPAYGVGLDLDAEAVVQAKQNFPHLHFFLLDAHDLQSSDIKGAFDYIILANTVGSLKDVQAVFEHLLPYCQPSTRLVISYHNPLWEGILQLASRLGQRMPMPATNWLSQGDINNLLNLAGYEVIKTGKQFLFPRHVPFLSGFFNRLLAPLPLINRLCITEYIVARPQPSTDHTPVQDLTCSVIIPARNEAGNIWNCVRRLPRMGSRTEIIFVEGHSSDDTWTQIQNVQTQLADSHEILALQQQGKGKADAVRLGFAAATGDVLIILDADLTVQAEEMTKFFQAIASGRCDFANGCRLIYPLSTTAMPTLNQWANRFFAALLSYILGIRIKDSLCGTKALRRSDYLEIAAQRHFFGDFDPFGDFDLLLGAVKQNLKVVDIPVRYYPRIYGQSNIQHVKEGIQLLKICGFAFRKFKWIRPAAVSAPPTASLPP